MYTSVRQTNRLRRRYLTAVLRQEVSFFDTQVRASRIAAGFRFQSLGLWVAQQLALPVRTVTAVPPERLGC
jgi:hypothetical protein